MFKRNNLLVKQHTATQYTAAQHDYLCALATISIVTTLFAFPSLAYAADPFESGSGYLTGLIKTISIASMPIVIAFLGYSLWFSKLTLKLAAMVFGGSVMIFGAGFYSAEIMAALQ